MKFNVITTHAKAVAILAQVGLEPPVIPEGSNTSVMHFRTRDGLPAVVINQTGLAHQVSDDEQEVNGCTVIACSTEIEESQARAALDEFVEQLLKE